MATLKATMTAIDSAEFLGTGKETEYRIEGNPRLVLAVLKPVNGVSKKVWRCCYSAQNHEGRRTIRKVRLGVLGKPPRGMGLAEARTAAALIEGAVERGRDPVAERRQEEVEERRKSLTLTDLVSDYIVDHRRQGHATTGEIERALHAFLAAEGKAIASMRPSDIRPLDIQKAIDVLRERLLEKRGAKARGEMERRVLRYLKQAYNHALLDSEEMREKYGLVSSPADLVGRNRRGKVGRYGKAEARDRHLTDDEIRAFLAALDASGVDQTTRLLVRLLLATGARLGEVRCVIIEELHLEGSAPIWVLPAKRAKNRKAHRKPLSPMAVALFRVAIGDRRRGPVLLSEGSGDGFPTARGVRRAVSRLLEDRRLTIPPFTPHDLRRTVATGMARLGVPDDIVGRALGHSKSDVTNAVYIAHDAYEAEKRAAIEKWCAHLAMVIGSNGEAAERRPAP